MQHFESLSVLTFARQGNFEVSLTSTYTITNK
jgi:hypothetical protein